MASECRIIRSLVCHRDIAMALQCLGSLLLHATEPVTLVLHEDGSLTADDIERLLTGLPGSRMVRRKEADRIMDEKLRNLPACSAFRNKSPWALKLFDTVALCGEEDYYYVDSDILFFRPWSALFAPPPGGVGAVFMRDVFSYYSLVPWDYCTRPGLRVAERVNAGMMVIRKSRFDLGFFEWFLRDVRRAALPCRNIMVEQTAWAALGWKVGCHYWDTRFATLAGPDCSLTNNLVAMHFYGPWRSKLKDFVADSRVGRKDEVLSIPTVPFAPYPVWRATWDPAREWLRPRSRIRGLLAKVKPTGLFGRRGTNRDAAPGQRKGDQGG